MPPPINRWYVNAEARAMVALRIVIGVQKEKTNDTKKQKIRW